MSFRRAIMRSVNSASFTSPAGPTTAFRVTPQVCSASSGRSSSSTPPTPAPSWCTAGKCLIPRCCWSAAAQAARGQTHSSSQMHVWGSGAVSQEQFGRRSVLLCLCVISLTTSESCSSAHMCKHPVISAVARVSLPS